MNNDMKNKQVKILKKFALISSLFCSFNVFAAPIVVEGAVPNDMTKQAILAKLKAVYGDDQVVDKIQIRAVSAPNGWSDSVTRVITPDLKRRLAKVSFLYEVRKLSWLGKWVCKLIFSQPPVYSNP